MSNKVTDACISGNLLLAPMGKQWAITFLPSSEESASIDGTIRGVSRDVGKAELIACLKALNLNESDIKAVNNFDFEKDEPHLFDFDLVDVPMKILWKRDLVSV